MCGIVGRQRRLHQQILQQIQQLPSPTNIFAIFAAASPIRPSLFMIIANGAPVRIEQDAIITLEISSSFWIFSEEAMSRWRVWSDLRLAAISFGSAATMGILVGLRMLGGLVGGGGGWGAGGVVERGVSI